MPLPQLPTAHFIASVSVLVLMFALCGYAHSTTVAVLQSKQGLIILADSKQTQQGSAQTICRDDEIKKVFIVQGRFAITALGIGCLYGAYWENGIMSEVSYNIDNAWVQELQNSLPKNVSMVEFVKRARAKFSSLLPKLQSVLTAGYLYPSDPRDGRFETFITFVIAGYENGIPTTCILRFYIDWDTRRFIESSPWGGSFMPMNNMYMGFYVFGTAQAITDILNTKSYAYGQAMATCPKAFRDFISRKPISLDESISIGRVLIQIEEKVNPGKVGGKITGVQILPSGEASELSDSSAPPKSKRGEPEKKRK